uniref:Uncharacterized protein n=1 Tax=Oryzias latipes TaxID=8090 RepID=A0A3B3HI61_ORYLA
SGCWRRRTQSGCWRRRTQSGCWRRRTQSGCCGRRRVQAGWNGWRKVSGVLEEFQHKRKERCRKL